MLKQRLITAAILLPLVVAALLWLPVPALYALLGVLSAAAAWEWAGLASLQGAARLLYAAAAAGLFVGGWFLQAQWPPFAGVSVLLWLVIALMMPGFSPPARISVSSRVLVGLLGWCLLLACLLSLAALRAQANGAWRLLFTLSLVWAADTGAYFAGRRFGSHKLAPRVSPGKTWEGVAGGLVAVLLWSASAGAVAFGVSGQLRLPFLLLCLAAALLSIVGDLGVSLFKRRCGLKDTGRLLPGHGGILDRVDSLLAAAPVMALGAWWLRI